MIHIWRYRRDAELVADFGTCLRTFKNDRSGVVAIMTALLVSAISLACLGAIEIENALNTKLKVHKTLDSTLIRLGRSEARYAPQQIGEDHLKDMLKEAGIRVEDLETSFVFNQQTGAVQGKIKYRQPGVITGGLIPEMTFEVIAEALPQTTGVVEVALVLDASGSMAWSIDGTVGAAVGSRRIDKLDTATNALLDILDGNDQISPRVSVIPYATSVDITDLYASMSTGQRDAAFDGVDAWTLQSLGVRDLNASTLTYQDRSNGIGVWAAERFQSRNGANFDLSLDTPGGSDKMPVISQSPLQQWCNWSYIAWYGSYCIDVGLVYHENLYYIDGINPQRGVMPLTSNLQSVRDYVGSLEPKGGTAGHLGTIWGLYSLTPEWDTLFEHPEGPPEPYDDEKTSKMLVIMTDGDFNSNHASAMGGNEDSYAYFQSACALARSKNVRIFAIGLRVSDTAERELSACVGDTGRFFPVGSEAQLSEAFEEIGNSAGELRISG